MSPLENAENAMVEFKRILCPVDFSEFSFGACDYAMSLAKWYGAHIDLVHCVASTLFHPTQYPYLAEPLPALTLRKELLSAAEERVEVFASIMRSGDVPIEKHLEEGRAESSILELAARLESDLICMGTHGRSGLDRLVMGSVTERVLRRAPCPVLTVSRPGEESVRAKPTFATVLCPVDLSFDAEYGVSTAVSLAEQSGGRLVLLYVREWSFADLGSVSSMGVESALSSWEERGLERLRALVSDEVRQWCEVKEIVLPGKLSTYEHILNIAGEEVADLIVMGVGARNSLDLAVFGSTTHRVIRHAPCPVLTVVGSHES